MKYLSIIIIVLFFISCKEKEKEKKNESGIFDRVLFVHDTIYTPAKHDTLIIVENSKPKPNRYIRKKFKRAMWGPDTIFTHYPLYIDTTVEGKRIIRLKK